MGLLLVILLSCFVTQQTAYTVKNISVVEKYVGGRTILARSPTEAEVSQSDATNAAETKLTKRRVKARGRKMNIYAQAKDKLILGKKSLLGMV